MQLVEREFLATHQCRVIDVAVLEYDVVPFYVVHLLVGKVARQIDLEGFEEGGHLFGLVRSEKLCLNFHLQIQLLQHLILLFSGPLAICSSESLKIGANVQHEYIGLTAESAVLVRHGLQLRFITGHIGTHLAADLVYEAL